MSRKRKRTEVKAEKAPPASLAAAFDVLASIGPDFMPEGRDQGTAQEREDLTPEPWH